jgi:hypothetical protein
VPSVLRPIDTVLRPVPFIGQKDKGKDNAKKDKKDMNKDNG